MKNIGMLMVLVVIMAVLSVNSRSQSLARVQDVKATPAYKSLILKRVSLRGELFRQREMFTSQHPDVERSNYELSLLNKEIERMLASPSSQISKLSTVYADLILRKIDLQAEEYQLRRQVTASHPDLRQKRIELAALQEEIEDLLR